MILFTSRTGTHATTAASVGVNVCTFTVHMMSPQLFRHIRIYNRCDLHCKDSLIGVAVEKPGSDPLAELQQPVANRLCLDQRDLVEAGLIRKPGVDLGLFDELVY